MNAKIITVISILVVLIIATIIILFPSDLEPSKTITLCDKSHEEKYSWYQNIRVGEMWIPIKHNGIRTICDESHEVPNPAWEEWRIRNR